MNSQGKNLSYIINHIINEDIIEFECQEYEKRLFKIYIFNQIQENNQSIKMRLGPLLRSPFPIIRGP